MSDSDTGGEILGCLFGAPFVIGLWAALGSYQTFAEGYCASVIWRWFAVPLGLRPMTWTTFAGASLLLALSRIKLGKNEPKDERSGTEKTSAFLLYFAAPWLLLLIGWCIK